MIPKIIYFNFGFEEHFGNKPFNIVHFLAIKSAKVINEDFSIKLLYNFKPENNEWWEKSKEYCEHIHVIPNSKMFDNAKTNKYALIADLFRLDILIDTGGIYLDIDTICIKPFGNLLNYETVMGLELVDGKVWGLCNAVIIAKKDSTFLKLWKDEFLKLSLSWAEMAVNRPFLLSYRNIGSNHVWIEPHPTFFKYGWDDVGLKNMFENVANIDDCVLLHLWETKSYVKYLSKLTTDDIKTKDTTYNLISRKLIDI